MANFITDSFTEASVTDLTAHTPEVGGAWVGVSPWGSDTFQVGAGSGKATLDHGDRIAFFANTASLPSADYQVSAVVSVAGPDLGGAIGVIGRNQPSIVNCLIGWLSGGNKAEIYRYGGAGSATLASVAYTYTAGTSYTLALDMVGAEVTLKVNGVTVCTATDTSAFPAGRAGIWASGSTGLVTFDSFAAGDAVAVVAGATAITLSGPSSGTVGVASTSFSVAANGPITGTVVVTPAASPSGGTFTPASVSLSSGTPTGTFTFTPASTGAKTISVTNNGGLTNPASLTYTALAASGAISLTDITNRKIFQRSGGVYPVTVSGTYTGTPSAIEARVVLAGTETGAMAWTTIVASPSGGSYSATLSVPQGGMYNLQVRDASVPAAITTGANVWGVGDLIIVSGQSNASKLFSDETGLVTGLLTVSSIAGGNPNNWGPIQGNGAKSLGNTLTTALGVPIGLIPAAQEGAALVLATTVGYDPTNCWEDNTTYNNAYWRMQVDAVGGKVAGIVWAQGEWDATRDVAKDTYKSTLVMLIARMRTYLGQPTLPFFIVPLTTCNFAEYPGWNNVNDAFIELYSATIPKVCDAYDIPNDGLHYTQPGYIEMGRRAALAIAKYSGVGAGALGPKISSVSVASNVVDVAFTHNSGSDLTPATGITTFSFTANGATVTPTTLNKLSAATVRATFPSALTEPVTVSIAKGTLPNVSAPLKDSAGFPAQRTLTAGVSTSVKMVSLVLTTDGSTPAANLTGLKWAFFDGVTPDTFVFASAKGVGSTDAAGLFAVNVSTSALSFGAVGWLVVSNSDGTTTQDPAHKAFSGPVTVTAA